MEDLELLVRLRNASIKHSETVKKGEMSLIQASEVFGVPISMLHDRITGKVLFGSHSGPRRFLSEKEEEELVVFLTHCATIGYPRSRKDVMNIVQATLVQKGHHNTLYGIHSGKGILISPACAETFSSSHPYSYMKLHA